MLSTLSSFTFLQVAGLFGLATVPPLILLYLLKLKREDRVVSSTLLWREVMADLQANSPFQRLRRNLLMILQLLFLLLGTLALMRPVLRLRPGEGEDVVLIVDASASMKARDGGGGRTRFEAAQEDARELVRNLRGGDRMMVIEAARGARTLKTFTDAKADLLGAIDSLRAKDTATDLTDAILLAASALKQREGKGQVVLLSDGAAPAIPDLGDLLARLRFRSFGESSENAGITMLDVRRDESRPAPKNPGEKAAYQVFATVKNFGSAPRKGFVSLYAADKLRAAKEVELAPGEAASTLFAEDLAEGPIRVETDGGDILPADDAAYAYLAPERLFSVLLVIQPQPGAAAGGNPVLEKVFGIDPTIAAYAIDPSKYQDDPRWNLVVFDGWVPPELPEKPALYVNPPRDVGTAARVGAEVDYPQVLSWDRADPLFRYVDLGNVYFRRARRLEVDASARVLARWASADGTQGPLAVAFARKDVEQYVLPFDIYDSNWPLRVSFPVFMKNLTLQALRKGEIGLAPRVETGGSVPIQVPTAVGEVRITTPSGARMTIPGHEGRVYFGETDEAGIYRVEAGTAGEGGAGVSFFAANLLSEAESDCLPRPIQTRAQESVAPARDLEKVNREVWAWFASIALALCAIEWYIFHRRV